ncbi:MATE efflux family protein 3, chloroplastic [Hordeum vulgare]|nr:MATE efflux family protein 3, chloroplastic [Hordeum vulgare]
MMWNHARGLVKVIPSTEKERAFPAGFNIPPPIVLLPDSDSDDEVEELVVLSDKVEEEPIVQVLAPIIDVVEGDKNRPIDMEKLPEVADLPEVIVVKQEMEEDVGAPGKKKWDAEKKNAVWRSECLKMLKKEE